MKIKARYLRLDNKNYLIIKNIKNLDLKLNQKQRFYFDYLFEPDDLYAQDYPSYLKLLKGGKRKPVVRDIEFFNYIPSYKQYYIFKIKDKYMSDVLKTKNKINIRIYAIETEAEDGCITTQNVEYNVVVKMMKKPDLWW